LGCLAVLGVSKFETIDETRQHQRDLLQRLRRDVIDPGFYAGLEDCGTNYCGRLKCAEACYFGTRRRRLNEIAAVHRLLANVTGPLFEMRVVRGGWAHSFGQLHNVSIKAAKQLNRRALDNLYQAGIVAIGTVKVSAIPKHVGQRWMCEIHQIVAGAEKADLDRVFTPIRVPKNSDFVLWTKEVKDLGPTISCVLKRDLQHWQHPSSGNEETASRPKKVQRAEYYNWLLGLRLGARMVRYGCDAYFTNLNKPAKKLILKPPKKRPYPIWLEPHMFGRGRSANVDPQSMDYANKTAGQVPRRLQRVVDPPADYYDDVCDDVVKKK
jgi:hypothetical protein